ncbi:hypothetical protein Droror1_Dr00020804 [Drosera rotundifolia]
MGRPSSLKHKNGEETQPASEDQKRTRRIPTQLGPTAEPQSSPNNGNKQNEAGQGGYGNDKVDPSHGKGVDSLSLSDPAVLDCNHCLKPLTVPVYQCEDGHLACSECCSRWKNECYSCFSRKSLNRCRAIEKVIESLKAPCCYAEYGCKTVMSYCRKHEHEKACTHAPCSCPFRECLFKGIVSTLSQHLTLQHSDSVIHFSYNLLFPVAAKLHYHQIDKLIVLKEAVGDEDIFVVARDEGKWVVKACPENRRFTYDLIVRKGHSSVRFQGETGDLDCLILPSCFYASGAVIVELCISKNSASHPDISDKI